MLINSSKARPLNFESIHNYYEPLIIEEIMRSQVSAQGIEDSDYLEDVACVALNSLPARYVRHDVDMAFFMSTQERLDMMAAIRKAVADAAELVNQRLGEKRHTRPLGTDR